MFKNITRQQKFMLLVLSLINLFNYFDRQVIFPLFENIRLEFHLTDFQLGLLGSAFMFVHALASLPFGILADKLRRNWLISAGVLFWSWATFSSGLATSFNSLLFRRSLVGIGESAYAPAAIAMISESIPEKYRSEAHGIFNTGIFIGATLGGIVGGLIAFYLHNWRLALFISALPGIVLAVFGWYLPDTRTREMKNRLINFKLLNNAAYVWILLGGLLSTFATAGCIAWGIEFVYRYKGYNLRDSSIILGLTLMFAGVIGVILGSKIADWAHTKWAWGRSSTVAWSLILSAPFLYLGLSNFSGHYTFIIYLFLGTCLFSFYHGPTTAVIHDLMPADTYATAFAMYLLVIHLFGSALAPAVFGKISDMYDLQKGLEFTPILIFLAGLCFLMVSREIRKSSVVKYKDESIRPY
jgi:MFS family permease